MDDLSLMVDLHADGDRQGPGDDAVTRRAIALAGLPGRKKLAIADMGCGTGASTMVLARTLDAQIAAIDVVPEFLETLEDKAHREDLGEKITTHPLAMDALPFDDQSLDAIWSEGAIYNIGFENGARYWRRFLKADGILAVSEITWLTRTRPDALTDYWERLYPEIDTAAGKIAVLEANGYSPIGYFPLPSYCWLANYYRPLEAQFDAFLDRHDNSEAAQALVSEHREEIAFYERYADYFSYGFYIARRCGD